MTFLVRRRRLYALGAVLLLPLGAGAFLRQHPAVIEAAELFEQALETLSTRYVDSLPMDSLYLRAARGMVKEFHDPYTVVFTPDEAGAFQQYMTGTVTGIGVSLANSTTGYYIAYVYPGTPAAEGGLRVGDHITYVDSIAITHETPSAHIVGPAGTPVELTVERRQIDHARPDTLRITLTRAAVHRSVVPYTLMLEHHVGYVPLTQFGEGAADEVREAITSLADSGARRFVLDLRNNPGGLTNEAVALCGLFLRPGQVVVRMRGRSGEVVSGTDDTPPATTRPLAILVNQNTASAAEITSGALQDHDRALVIGQSTYGKGVGQELTQLPNGYMMKFTTMRWYTPLGRSVQRPHRLLPTGEYAETPPDSFETPAQRLKRPPLKSEGGRVVYGGGGIVPDMLARDTGDIALQVYLDSALKTSVWPMQSVLSSYAVAVAPTASKPVKVTPAMRAQVVADLRMNGIVIPAPFLKAHAKLLDRAIAERIAFVSGGVAAARRVSLENDVSLSKAVSVLGQSTTQAEVFSRAARMQ